MKSRPKSPLDSRPLERGAGRGRGYFEESKLKPESFSEKEQRGSRGREREREPDTSADVKHGNGIVIYIVPPTGQAEQATHRPSAESKEYPGLAVAHELGVPPGFIVAHQLETQV